MARLYRNPNGAVFFMQRRFYCPTVFSLNYGILYVSAEQHLPQH